MLSARSCCVEDSDIDSRYGCRLKEHRKHFISLLCLLHDDVLVVTQVRLYVVELLRQRLGVVLALGGSEYMR